MHLIKYESIETIPEEKSLKKLKKNKIKSFFEQTKFIWIFGLTLGFILTIFATVLSNLLALITILVTLIECSLGSFIKIYDHNSNFNKEIKVKKEAVINALDEYSVTLTKEDLSSSLINSDERKKIYIDKKTNFPAKRRKVIKTVYIMPKDKLYVLKFVYNYIKSINREKVSQEVNIYEMKDLVKQELINEDNTINLNNEIIKKLILKKEHK